MNRRLIAAAALALSLVLPTAPALAAPTHSSITATPTTAHIGSVVVVAGVVTPRAAQTLAVQRFVAPHWVTVAHTRSTKTGLYTVSLRAPHHATTWRLRVVDAKATSATVRVHVVSRQFTVRASVSATDPLTLVGTVTPRSTGTVALQGFQRNSWQTLTTAKLTTSGAFTFTKTEPAGSYSLRVVKDFTATIAAGTSTTLHATVSPPPPGPPAPPPPPTITTGTLPRATAGIAYTATLSATGGTGPYTWSVFSASLPAGLHLAPTGVVSGSPTLADVGPSTLLVTVTDSAGRASTAGLVLSVTIGAGSAWGYDNSGQLGDGGTTRSADPLALGSPAAVVAMAGGQSTGYALTADGRVWSWGLNSAGEAGTNSVISSQPVPTVISTLSGVTAIAAGSSSAYAVKSDGTVWGWGYDHNGELGNGSILNSVLPVQVSGLAHVVAIAALASGGYALEADGTVWAWGAGTGGDLGAASAGPAYLPVQVIGVSEATAIAAGRSTGYAVLSNGTVVAWGANEVGQLGNGTLTASTAPVPVIGLGGVTSVAATNTSAFALRSGTVWAWGGNNEGELANGTTSTAQATPAAIGGLSGVTALAGGELTGYAATADGSLWAWGDNGVDQLGNGTTAANVLTPTRVSGLSGVLSVGSGCSAVAGYAVSSG